MIGYNTHFIQVAPIRENKLWRAVREDFPCVRAAPHRTAAPIATPLAQMTGTQPRKLSFHCLWPTSTPKTRLRATWKAEEVRDHPHRRVRPSRNSSFGGSIGIGNPQRKARISDFLRESNRHQAETHSLNRSSQFCQELLLHGFQKESSQIWPEIWSG